MPLLEDLYAKERAREVAILPFFYSAPGTGNFATIAAGATAVENVPIQSDSHFVCRYFNLTIYTNSVVVTVTPPFRINFFDTGSGRTIQDNPQPIQNLCGGVAAAAGLGNLPFILPEPWLIRAGGVIQVTLINDGLTTLGPARLSLCGFKVFKFGSVAPAEL